MYVRDNNILLQHIKCYAEVPAGCTMRYSNMIDVCACLAVVVPASCSQNMLALGVSVLDTCCMQLGVPSCWQSQICMP